MKPDWFVKCLLLLIAVLLGVIALRPAFEPPPVLAQAPEIYPFYVEPGTATIRAPDGTQEVLGKVFIDLRNGNIWGFPTGSKAPYPILVAESKPPVVQGIYLGRFDFSSTNKH